jgi:hypothetical protein
MSYGACRRHSCGLELTNGTKVLDGIVPEQEYPLVAPPQLDSEPQMVMDRLLRDFFESRSLTEKTRSSPDKISASKSRTDGRRRNGPIVPSVRLPVR